MYSKKGFLDRATWNRLPTRGQPGGPGGSLRRFVLGFLVRKKIKPERQKAMRDRVDEEKKEAIAMWDVKEGVELWFKNKWEKSLV